MKITIITVCFNSAATILDSLHSVNSQTWRDIEHIVIDGGSTDGTVELVRNHGREGLIVQSEPDDGIYEAMNKGLRLASGDVVGFLNSDDFYAADDVIERVAAVMEDSSVAACYADLVYVTPDNRKVVRYWKSRPFEPGSFANGWCPAHPTLYVRRSTIEQLGAFDLSYRLAADTEFMMRYLEKGLVKTIYIPKVFVRMRVGGATNRSWRNILLQNQEIFHALRKNGVKHSVWSFWLHKLSSRIWQRLAGFNNAG
jgi:glycosyltransferase involved in cell wall biosynthesis